MRKWIEQFKAWQQRRHWGEQHMDFIRMRVSDDLRWLSVDPVGKEIMERYERIVSQDWYKFQHEPIDAFRRRIGLCPHKKKHKLPW